MTTPATSENPTGFAEGCDAYFRRLGRGRFAPSVHSQGAWRTDELHLSPVAGLLTHCLERFNPRDDLQLARLTFDVLGQIPARPFDVACQTLRPGRTIELDEVVLAVDGRDIVRGTAWRLSRQDTSAVAGGPADPLPGPESFEDWTGRTPWSGGFIASLDLRRDPGTVPGRGRAWARTRHALVEGEESTPLASYVALVDTANGIAVRVPPQEWIFPNTDLTIHVFRSPERGWTGFETEVTFGPSGVGLTSSTLHDEEGPIGRAEQILTVREAPPATPADGASRPRR